MSMIQKFHCVLCLLQDRAFFHYPLSRMILLFCFPTTLRPVFFISYTLFTLEYSTFYGLFIHFLGARTKYSQSKRRPAFFYPPPVWEEGSKRPFLSCGVIRYPPIREVSTVHAISYTWRRQLLSSSSQTCKRTVSHARTLFISRHTQHYATVLSLMAVGSKYFWALLIPKFEPTGRLPFPTIPTQI